MTKTAGPVTPDLPEVCANDPRPVGRDRYKAVITLWGQYVGSRFDQTSEALVATIDHGRVERSATVVLAHPSADELCQLILAERADVVVCGGIQRRYYEYLSWKKVCIYDSVMGPWERALELLCRGELGPESILYEDDGEEG